MSWSIQDSGRFIKQETGGVYSSADFLTKVLSVKSNDFMPIELFSQDDIDIIIEKNENLAIFDNGNLFAKNAWIEGNINATSGTISGTLSVSGTL
jgi:hypothetical protein